MGKAIQDWMKTENPNSSADLAPSLSSSHRTNHPPSSLHPSTPASLPTRATCALQCACQTTPPPCPRTRLHPSCLLCGRARDSTSPPSSPTLPATKSCHRHHCRRLRPNQRRVACCGPVRLIRCAFVFVFTISTNEAWQSLKTIFILYLQRVQISLLLSCPWSQMPHLLASNRK